MPAVLDRPSGTLEMKTAASIAGLTAPPANSPTPRTTDSRMPSMSAPTAMAVPLPGESFSVGWGFGALPVLRPRPGQENVGPNKDQCPQKEAEDRGEQPSAVHALVHQFRRRSICIKQCFIRNLRNCKKS